MMERIVYPIGTLTGDAAAAADVALARSFEQTVALEGMAFKRQALEDARKERMVEALAGLRESRGTEWYRRWAVRQDRSKYSPGECQAEGKR